MIGVYEEPTLDVPVAELVPGDRIPSRDDLSHHVNWVSGPQGDGLVHVQVERSDGERYVFERRPQETVAVVV